MKLMLIPLFASAALSAACHFVLSSYDSTLCTGSEKGELLDEASCSQ